MAQPIPMRPTRRRQPPAKPRQADRKPLLAKSGRAWINGNEVGGVDPRFAHLNRSYD